MDPAETLALSAEHERLVYRVAQECLRNVAKHAAPCTAAVTLYREDAGAVLDIVDDGSGFDAKGLLEMPAEDHFGLRVLADVASSAGALLQVASAPGRGTHWRLVVPAAGAGGERA
jgi:two-component system, NarL family, sensor kinase